MNNSPLVPLRRCKTLSRRWRCVAGLLILASGPDPINSCRLALDPFPSRSSELVRIQSPSPAIDVRNKLQHRCLVLVLHPRLPCLLRACATPRDYPFLYFPFISLSCTPFSVLILMTPVMGYCFLLVGTTTFATRS